MHFTNWHRNLCLRAALLKKSPQSKTKHEGEKNISVVKGFIDTEKALGKLSTGACLWVSSCSTPQRSLPRYGWVRLSREGRKGPWKLLSAILYRPGNTTCPSTGNFTAASCPGNVTQKPCEPFCPCPPYLGAQWHAAGLMLPSSASLPLHFSPQLSRPISLLTSAVGYRDSAEHVTVLFPFFPF